MLDGMLASTNYFLKKGGLSEGYLSDLSLRRLAPPAHLMQDIRSKLILIYAELVVSLAISGEDHRSKAAIQQNHRSGTVIQCLGCANSNVVDWSEGSEMEQKRNCEESHICR